MPFKFPAMFRHNQVYNILTLLSFTCDYFIAAPGINYYLSLSNIPPFPGDFHAENLILKQVSIGEECRKGL